MEKEKLERQLKTEIELFKMYIIILIGVTTGVSSIIIGKKYSDNFVLFLLVAGIIIFVMVFIVSVTSFFRIKKLTNS